MGKMITNLIAIEHSYINTNHTTPKRNRAVLALLVPNPSLDLVNISTKVVRPPRLKVDLALLHRVDLVPNVQVVARKSWPSCPLRSRLLCLPLARSNLKQKLFKIF